MTARETAAIVFCAVTAALPRLAIAGCEILEWGSVTLADRIRDVEVVDDHAYLAGGRDGLFIVDVSDRTTPVVVGSLDTPGFFQDVEVVGNLAYVAASDFEDAGGLVIIDVAAPDAPEELARIGSSFTRVDVKGGLAYVTNPKSGLEIIDIANPIAPVQLGSLDLLGHEYDAHVVGNLAYVPVYRGEQSSAVRIVDISVPTLPFETGSIDTGDKLPLDIEVMNDVGYVPVVGGKRRGLILYDLWNPTSPVELAFLAQPSARDVRLIGDRAYFAFGTDISFGGGLGGFRVIDTSDLTIPVVVGNADTTIDESAALDVEVEIDGHWIYLGVSGLQSGLRIYRVADCPTVLPYYVMPDDPTGSIPITVDTPIATRFYGSETLDVNDFDIGSFAFGPAGATVMTDPGFQPRIFDANADGYDDLVVYFHANEAGFAEGDQQGCIEGSIAGQAFAGCDWASMNLPPIVLPSSFEWWNATVPMDLECDGTASNDPEGSALQYIWQFSNGLPDAFTPTVTHPLTEPDSFEVTLTVVDDLGQASAMTYTVWASAPVAPTSIERITTQTPETALRNPRISGNEVVWSSSEDGDWEVFRWNEAGIANLSNDTQPQLNPTISGSRVTWSSRCVGCPDDEIYLWNEGVVSQITSNDTDDRYPEISGSSIVWQHRDPSGPGGDDWEIYYYDGISVTALTNNDSDDTTPVISGSQVAWAGEDGIYLWDGTTATNISGVCNTCAAPDISGSRVVWTASDGNDDEIYLWDGIGITQITNNMIPDRDPSVSGTKVVWEGSIFEGFGEIFYWDGDTIYQITDNFEFNTDPDISGDRIVWMSHKEYAQIFIARPPDEVPAMSAGLLLVTVACVGLLGFQFMVDR